MNNTIDRAAFESFYAGNAPWDIGRPQTPFVAVADLVENPVLDAGCGTGDNALLFATQDHCSRGRNRRAGRRLGPRHCER